MWTGCICPPAGVPLERLRASGQGRNVLGAQEVTSCAPRARKFVDSGTLENEPGLRGQEGKLKAGVGGRGKRTLHTCINVYVSIHTQSVCLCASVCQ